MLHEESVSSLFRAYVLEIILTKRKTRARLALTVQEVMCLEKILSFRPGPG